MQALADQLIVDLFRVAVTALALIYMMVGRNPLIGILMVVGVLSGSLNGLLTNEVEKVSSTLVSETLMLLILGIGLALFYGRFFLRKTAGVIVLFLLPVAFSALTLVSNDYDFIQSEAKKYLIFLVFFLVNLSLDWRKFPNLLELSVHTIMVVALAAVLVFWFLGLGYEYGSESFALIPVSVMLVPIAMLFKRANYMKQYCVIIVILVLFGILQPSSKLILIYALIVGILLFEKSAAGIMTIILLPLVLVNGLLIFDDIARHKVFSVISLLEVIPDVFRGNGAVGESVVFVTSAGNIFAELLTVLRLLTDQYFAPIGVGFALTDPFGWLSMANEYAYDASASVSRIFPLHLGVFYLLVWFGPFIFFFLKYSTSFFFLSAFCVLGLSAPSTILLSGIISPFLTRSVQRAFKANTG